MNTIFYDASCSLCQRSVAWIKQRDKHHIFAFEPLKKETDSLILVEGKKKWIRGRAVMRILWLLGGKWKLVGWLYVVPFVDFFYRLVARHRRLF
ncbi:MAG: DUF393 domain-containing protein [Verrucomicrobia bacterium]|nr:DUF393 domain-containing protein [Verrucomicrobiota bacterium]